MSLTPQSLRDVMGGALSLERYAQLFPAVNQALLDADCTTVPRSAMWFAQVGHESVGLKYMQEIWGPTAQQAGYEGRADLGNTVRGDGFRFRGHGPIQITGRANHATVSRWAFERGIVPTPTYFVDFPDELAGDRFGFVGVTWYWTSARNMNRYADANDIVGATRAVNGGTYGLDDRRARWQRALAMGAAILPAPAAQLLIPDLEGIFLP